MLPAEDLQNGEVMLSAEDLQNGEVMLSAEDLQMERSYAVGRGFTD